MSTFGETIQAFIGAHERLIEDRVVEAVEMAKLATREFGGNTIAHALVLAYAMGAVDARELAANGGLPAAVAN